MVPGPDSMAAPTSFTARRPNASHLPSFELPPPPLAGLQQKYHQPSYSHHTSQAPATTLTSVGNLLTPPSNGSADGLSPGNTSHSTGPAYSPNGSGMWPPPSNGGSTPSYGFQQSSASQYHQGRGLYSPSLNSIVRGSNSPSASELPPPPYEMPHYANSTMSMSAPNLPAMPQHQQPQMMAPGPQPSPANSHESFSRPPPTPSYSYSSQSSAPQQSSYSYSGPSPVQQSPSTQSMPRMSPISQQGQAPPAQHQSQQQQQQQHHHHHQSQQQQQYAQHRPYSYSMPVLTNVNNPGGQMSMVGGGVPHSMMAPYNSGQAAHYSQMYAHHPQQANPPNDRPFRCDQCPQSFNRNHDLKRHKRIHLAVKPFPCGHCDKSFSRKDALKRHVLVKGCGKAHATMEVKELDGSMSPSSKSGSQGNSPIISASA
ncbi:C2H2 finger domain protein [Zymoseptoria brevis]|uniref:C2H2 finger domain protein n=1 Tax=Zymoseptoria brevis TaxID=1047168 RepID=A0A0F4GY41_9PEZI|nr:C2H2 finger domain protein [Zymoseptoria brevis]